MKWPLVSRRRYVRLLKKFRESEKERKSLLDMVLNRTDTLEELATALPDPKSKEAEELLDTATGTLTISGMKRLFREQMRKTGRG